MKRIAMLVLLGCGGEIVMPPKDAGTVMDGGAVVMDAGMSSGENFGTLYTNIFQPQCAAPCHHASTNLPTTLYLDTQQGAYDTLLGTYGAHPSEVSMPYVQRGNPNGSYLFLKLHPSPPAGGLMPGGVALPEDQIDKVRAWIAGGAPLD